MSSAELWSGGQYELVAARFAEIHDALVESSLRVRASAGSTSRPERAKSPSARPVRAPT